MGGNQLVTSIKRRVVRLPIERPWRTLLVGILLLAALGAGGSRIKVDANTRVWFPPDDPNIRQLNAFERRFGHDVSAVLVVHSPSGVFDKETAKLLIELTERMEKVTEVIRVDSLSSFPWVHAEGDEILVEDLIPEDLELTDELLAERRKVALAHKQLPGFLVSRDGKSAVIIGWLQPSEMLGGENDYEAINKELKQIVAERKGKGDEQFYLGGTAVFDYTMKTLPAKDSERLMPMMLGMVIVILILFFRRASGVLLPFSVVLPSVGMMIGFAGWVGLTINPVTNIAPLILIAIAVSNTMHLLVPYFRALDAGLERRKAAEYALDEAIGPNFFACLTIAIGFLSFITAPIVPLRQLGLMITAGSLGAWLLIWLVLGPLTVLVRVKRKPRKDDLKEEALREPPEGLRRLTSAINRRRVPIVAVWLLVVAGFLFMGVRNRVDQRSLELFPKDEPIRVSLEFMAKHFGWSQVIETVIDSGSEDGIKDPEFLRKVDEFEQWVRAHQGVGGVASIIDTFKLTNQSLAGGDPNQYRIPDSRQAVAEQYLLYTLNLPVGMNLNDRISLKSDALRMSVFVHIPQSSDVLETIDEFKAKAKELGLNVRFTGLALLFDQMNPYLVKTMLRSIITSVLPMALLLIFLFRSVRLGLFSIIPDLVPLVVGAGALYLLGQNYDIGTVIVFSVAIGLSVDDTVHWLTVYSRARHAGLDRPESMARTFMILPAVVVMTTVLVCAFALLMMSGFTPIRHLGLMVALMLVVNLVADILLLPALLLLFNRPKR